MAGAGRGYLPSGSGVTSQCTPESLAGGTEAGADATQRVVLCCAGACAGARTGAGGAGTATGADGQVPTTTRCPTDARPPNAPHACDLAS